MGRKDGIEVGLLVLFLEQQIGSYNVQYDGEEDILPLNLLAS